MNSYYVTIRQLKILSIVLILIFLGIWGVILYIGGSNVEANNSVAAASASPTPTPVPEIKPGIPLVVMVPKIGISAFVESVGVDTDGRMDVPKKDENVGWYDLGFRPGEKGSAVLAGHLDKVTGAPAIFWNLNKLEVGDEIYVVDDKNQTFKFVVTDKKNYVYNQVPIDEIFQSSGESTLNLITCGGTFNQAARNYSNRTIVFAKRVDSSLTNK